MPKYSPIRRTSGANRRSGTASNARAAAAAARLRVARQERARQAARIRSRVPPYIHSPVNNALTRDEVSRVVDFVLSMSR